MKEVTFVGTRCVLKFGTYPNGRVAIRLVSSDGPFGVATVNIPDAELAPNEVCIKSYSENEGMLDALVKARVVAKPHRTVQSGYVVIPVCKLLVRP